MSDGLTAQRQDLWNALRERASRVARLRSALAALPGGRRRQSFVTAIQSTSTSKGPVHSGTQKKMRAGGFFGKKRL
jgi:hypothetical protein